MLMVTVWPWAEVQGVPGETRTFAGGRGSREEAPTATGVLFILFLLLTPSAVF